MALPLGGAVWAAAKAPCRCRIQSLASTVGDVAVADLGHADCILERKVSIATLGQVDLAHPIFRQKLAEVFDLVRLRDGARFDASEIVKELVVFDALAETSTKVIHAFGVAERFGFKDNISKNLGVIAFPDGRAANLLEVIMAEGLPCIFVHLVIFANLIQAVCDHLLDGNSLTEVFGQEEAFAHIRSRLMDVRERSDDFFQR